MTAYRIAVIGAGVGGLAAALALKQRGHQVMVYEKHQSQRNAGAGITLWSNAAYALDQLGVLDHVVRHGKVMNRSQLRTAANRLLAELPLEEWHATFQYPTFSVSRTDLHDALIEAIGKELVVYGKRCTGFEQNRDEGVVRFEDETKVQADLVVAADGIHSFLRKQWLNDPLRYSGYISWRGMTSFDTAALSPGVMYEFWGAGCRFGFVPISDKQLYWFATQNAEHGLKLASMKRHLAEIFTDFPPLVKSAIDMTPEMNIIQTDICDRVPVRSFVNGRLVLLGDAAHPTTPNLGQGACMALEDAIALSKVLERSSGLSAALHMYDALRVGRAKEIVRASWNWGRMAQLEGKYACLLRNRLVKLTPSAIKNKQWGRIIAPSR